MSRLRQPSLNNISENDNKELAKKLHGTEQELAKVNESYRFLAMLYEKEKDSNQSKICNLDEKAESTLIRLQHVENEKENDKKTVVSL